MLGAGVRGGQAPRRPLVKTPPFPNRSIPLTPENRLRLICRIVRLLREEIERSGGRYDGRMVPNLTSITDAATIEDGALVGAMATVERLEAERGIR